MQRSLFLRRVNNFASLNATRNLFVPFAQSSSATPNVAQQNLQLRHASKASGGSTQNKHDSWSKRLGVKKFSGTKVRAGNILVRQVGNKYWPGYNVGQGKDFTLYALKDGNIHFTYDEKFGRMYVCVSQRLAQCSQQKPSLQVDANGEEVQNATGKYQVPAEQLVTANGLPIKRIPNSQVHKIPKLKNYQVRYVVDKANLGGKIRFRTSKPMPIPEPKIVKQ